MRIIFKILTVCLLIVSYTQTAYAMNAESIAQILNSTFNVEFTSKQIDSLSKQDRTNLENTAQKAVMGQLLVASGISGIESNRQEALQNITKVVEALVPDDPLKTGLQKAIGTVAGPVAGKADMAIKVGSIISLLPSLIKNINEKYELPFINIYLQERNNGKTHDDAWKIATTGDNRVLIEAGIPAGLNLEKTKEKSKELFESSRLVTAQSSEWNQSRKNEVLPLFESAKKNEEQKSTFLEKAKNKAKDLLKPIIEKLIPTAKEEQIKIINMQQTLPTNLPMGKVADKDNLTGRNQTAGQDKLTPVGVTFNETFTGTMSQTIGEWGHSSTPFEGNFNGTRTRVLPGNFTGTFTGTNTYDAPLQANPNYINKPFTGFMNGTVKGFKEGDIKGSVNVTIRDNNVPNSGNVFTYSGNVTIKQEGSLNGTLSLPEGQSRNNYQYGICAICPGYVGTSTIQINQSKTTP